MSIDPPEAPSMALKERIILLIHTNMSLVSFASEMQGEREIYIDRERKDRGRERNGEKLQHKEHRVPL